MLKTVSRLALCLLLAVGLSACDTIPRGAALQNEVLREADGDPEEGIPVQFMVAPVTRDRLATYDAWPRVGEQSYRWIGRVQQPANRIIAPGDTLSITIWNTEENGLLTAPGQRFVKLDDLRVSPSGSVFLPYIGTQRLSGMSPERAREVIEEKYIQVTPSAQVQVALAEGRQSTVSLIGAVGASGVYPLEDRNVTLLSMLATAGGVSGSVANPQVRLHRNGQVYGTALSRLYDDPDQNTTLQAGDRIIVEEDDRFFMSLGAAGTESLHPFPRDGLHALEAVSVMGGVADGRADPQGILILRDYPGSAVGKNGLTHDRVVFTIDLTSADGLFSAGKFHIRSGDVVYATEAPFTTAQSIFGAIGSVLGLGRQFSN